MRRTPFEQHVIQLRRLAALAAADQGLSAEVVDNIVVARTAGVLRTLAAEEAAEAVADHDPDDGLGGDAA
jgi:hypothetical protein